jgi:hypothetical protein
MAGAHRGAVPRKSPVPLESPGGRAFSRAWVDSVQRAEEAVGLNLDADVACIENAVAVVMLHGT